MSKLARILISVAALVTIIPKFSDAQQLSLDRQGNINASPNFPDGRGARFRSGATLTLDAGATLDVQLAHARALLDTLGNTRGAMIYRGLNGYTIAIPGTAGYVWTSAGPGADPYWAAPSGGGGDVYSVNLGSEYTAGAATFRANIGATTLGSNLFTLPNPGAIVFIRVNADNTVSLLNVADYRNALGLVPGTHVQAQDPDLSALAAGLTGIIQGLGNGSGFQVAANSAALLATTASFTAADRAKLDGIEPGATADQTAAEVVYDPSGTGMTSTNLQAVINELKNIVDDIVSSGGYTDEMAQDAVGAILADSSTIDFTYNDAEPAVTAAVRTQMSLTSDAGGLRLTGDSASPGNDRYYGTNASGVKGFYALPAGGGGGGGYATIQEEGSDITQRLILNFVGAAITAADDSGSSRTNITLDGDLNAIASLSGTNTIYYRSGANTWSPVTIGSNLTFSGGTLAATGGGSSAPGGSSTQVQFNDGGTLAGDAGLVFDKVTNNLTGTGIFQALGFQSFNRDLGFDDVSAQGFQATADFGFGWTPGANWFNGMDTTLWRGGVGIVDVTVGERTVYGQLRAAGVQLRDTSDAHFLILAAGSDLTADRVLSIVTGDAARTLTIAGDGAVGGAITSSGYFMTSARLLGRTTASAGAIEEISIGAGLQLASGVLSATGGGSGAGDVVGPASAVDNALARFDTTTGKLIQSSLIAVDDAGGVSGVTSLKTKGTVSGPVVEVVRDDGVFASSAIITYAGGFTLDGGTLLLRHARGTEASPSSTQLNDVLGAVTFSGYPSSGGWPALSSAKIEVRASEAYTSTVRGSYMAFLTTDLGSTNRQERMRISALGNLLVGTTSDTPYTTSGNLSVAGGISAGGTVRAGVVSAGVVRLAETQGTGDNYVELRHYNTSLSSNRLLLLNTPDNTFDLTFTGSQATISDWFDQSVKVAAAPRFFGLRLTETQGTGNNYVELRHYNTSLSSNQLLLLRTPDNTFDLTFTGTAATLTGTNTGDQTGTTVSFADPDSKFAATSVGAAIAELDNVNASGPNATDFKVHWSQIGGMPAGFADGSDDGSGGGGGGYATVQEEGTALTQRTVLNFIGGGLTAADNAGSGRTDVTLDADLSALAALSGTNTLYYRSGVDTWSPVTIGSNLTFSGGTLAATGGGGAFDATVQDALTWSDGANASNAWTFDISGTDPVLTARSGGFDITGGLSASAGYAGNLTSLAGQPLTLTTADTNRNIELTPHGTGITTTGKRLTVTDVTSSSSSTTGALVVTGGIGVGGAANFGSTVTATGFFAGSTLYGQTNTNLVGNRTLASWGTTGLKFNIAAATHTDNSAAGTVASAVTASLLDQTYTSTNARTITDAASWYISGPPIAGANTTITNPWSLWVDAGDIRLDGGINLGGTVALSAAELGFVDGVTSSIQAQLNGKAPVDHTHIGANITSPVNWALGLWHDEDAVLTYDGNAWAVAGAGAFRTALGLVPGTDVASQASLAAKANLSGGNAWSGNQSGMTLVAPALGTPTSGNFSTGTFTWPVFTDANVSNSLSASVLMNANSTSQPVFYYDSDGNGWTFPLGNQADLRDTILAQPVDPDLTSLASASATNAIYYRSGANTWSPVTIGSNLTFSGGVLDAEIGILLAAATYSEYVIHIPGSLGDQAGAVFGRLVMPAAGRVERITLEQMGVPAATATTVDIVNSSSVNQSRVATLAAGAVSQTTDITDLTFASDSVWGIRVLSGSNGDTLTVRLLVRFGGVDPETIAWLTPTGATSAAQALIDLGALGISAQAADVDPAGPAISAALAERVPLAGGTDGQVLVVVNGVKTPVTMSGDATIDENGVVTINGATVPDFGADVMLRYNNATDEIEAAIAGTHYVTPDAMTAKQNTITGTEGQILLINSSGVPVAVTMSGDATINAAGVVTIDAVESTATEGSLVKVGAGGVLENATAGTDHFAPGAANILAEGGSILLDPVLSADGTYTITRGITGTGGATIAFGDLVHLSSADGRWELVSVGAALDAVGDARGLIGIAVTASTDGGAITVMLEGNIRADAAFPTLTVGRAVFASTSGDISLATPTTSGHVIRVIGHALTADSIIFAPAAGWSTYTP